MREAESLEGRRNVTVILEASPNDAAERHDVALIDVSWLETLVVEVVSNALKHARSRVVVSLVAGDESLAVRVVDDGRGPPPKVRGLFEPSNERSGLGISLSLAARVMSESGGILTVRPGPEGGADVRLELARRAEAKKAPTHEKNGVHGGAHDRGHVLVVDVDADTVDLVSYAIERAGFATSLAGSLSEARTRLAEDKPDAVITDLSLPDGAGTDIASCPIASGLRAKILVSGHKGAAVQREAVASGFDYQLVKPVDLDELIGVLSKSLGR